jgi:hypothetical protein
VETFSQDVRQCKHHLQASPNATYMGFVKKQLEPGFELATSCMQVGRSSTIDHVEYTLHIWTLCEHHTVTVNTALLPLYGHYVNITVTVNIVLLPLFCRR